MKKVIASAAGILFAVFGIAILGLLMSLTFGALGKLFPNNFTNQLWGLVLFDLAAMIWALVFVFRCESTGQYAIAAIGFLASFVGTLGMVAVEVMLGGQTFVEVEDWVGQWLVYGFVIMTALHSALLYAHHATAPAIHEKINVGIARGEIVTEAIRQATQSLEVQKAALAQSIHHDIVNQVKRDLGLARGQVLDLPALPVESPAAIQKPNKKNIGMPAWFLNLRRKFVKRSEPVTTYGVGLESLIDGQQPLPIRRNEYALPCGHTQGAEWNGDSYACKVCHKPFNLDELGQEKPNQGARPKPQPIPSSGYVMPPHDHPAPAILEEHPAIDTPSTGDQPATEAGESPVPFRDGEQG